METRSRTAAKREVNETEQIEEVEGEAGVSSITGKSHNNGEHLIEEVQRQGTLLTAICEKQEEKLQRQNEKIEKLEEQNETLRSIITR
jgi:hypothetical protein